MRILLTNDDGINAPGLKVLEEIARQFSDDIWVCAPSEEQSGAGHSLTLTRPVRLQKLDERRFAVTGTPTDSVMMALRTVMPEAPDIILSGVNRGANLGDDITYSGTVSAAIEGALVFGESDVIADSYHQFDVSNPLAGSVAGFEGPIDQPGDVAAALQRAIAKVRAGQPALLDTITQKR